MFEIIPNWHPIFVHFTIGLLITAAILLVAGRWRGNADILAAARWNLWLGGLAVAATVITGFLAYNSVAHDAPSHAAMHLHRNWALPTAALFLLAALWSLVARSREPERRAPFLVLVLVAAAGLTVTGWLGAENVYRYGLGVMSLPKAEDEGHAHGDGGEAASHEHGNESGGDAATHAHDRKSGDMAPPHAHDGENGGEEDLHGHDAEVPREHGAEGASTIPLPPRHLAGTAPATDTPVATIQVGGPPAGERLGNSVAPG